MMDSEKGSFEAGTEELLGLAEAAKLLHVHRNTLRNWTNNGMIKAYRIGNGGDRRFSLGDLLAFLNGRSTAKPNGAEEGHAAAAGAAKRR